MVKGSSATCGLGRRFAVGAALVGTVGCSSVGGDDHDGFAAETWKVIQTMQPLATEMLANPCNKLADDDNTARLGQMLFFERQWADAITVDGLSGKKGETGKVGCVNCHDPAHYFMDTRVDPATGTRTATSSGLGAPGKRNTPVMVNLGWNTWTGWTARFDWLTMHGAGAAEASTSRLSAAHYVYRKYRDEYNLAFPATPLDPALDPAAPDAARFPMAGKPKPAPTAAMPNPPDGPWEMMDPADQKIILKFMSNLGRAWEAYPRKLVTHGSPFERYMMGDRSMLTAEAKRGLELFVNKAACSDCHTGALLSDGKAHNAAVPMASGATTPDIGRFADIPATLANPFNGAGEYSDDPEAGRQKLMTLPAQDDSLKGQFRTPQLLNIAETGPYFHTGQFKTLEEVVDHYNQGGAETGFAGVKDPKLKPLMLTAPEKTDLVAFLKSLTGDAPAEEWTKDISKP
jgi:cytochrome c peroxidase